MSKIINATWLFALYTVAYYLKISNMSGFTKADEISVNFLISGNIT